MKKYIYLLVLTFLTFFMGWYGIENINLEAFNEEVDVVVDSVFDGSNTILGEPVGLSLGSKTTVNAPGDASGLEFAYWIVNGVVRKDLPLNYQFTITSNMHLLAVFHPTNENVVLFIDSNGQLIGEPHYVTDGGSVTAPTTLPDKPGLVVDSVETWVEASGQGVNFSNVTANAVYVLQYVSDTVSTFNISVSNGVGSGVYDYNNLVTVTANADNGGLVFSHWEEAGKVVSRNRIYEFTALYDRSLTAVFKEVKDSDLPLVFMSDDLTVRSGYETYVGQAYLPSGYELIEVGYLISQEAEILIRETAGVKVVQNNNPQARTLEFVTSFPIGSFQAIRAYMIVKNGLGELEVIYSGQSIQGTTYTQDFSSLTTSNSSYSTSVQFTDSNGFAWDMLGAQNVGSWTLGNSSDASFVQVTTDNGIDSFQVDLVRAFTNTNVRSGELLVNGISYGSFTVDINSDIPVTWSVNDINVSGAAVIKIVTTSPGSRGSFIVDNIQWTSYSLSDSADIYTVSYETNSGSYVNPEALISGSVATQPANPTKNGYTFDGWYTDEALTNTYSFSTPVTSNITLYAKYTPTTYSISYNLDGGDNSLVNPSSYTIEDSAIILEPATRTGYSFLGWYNSVGQLVTSIASGSYGNITLYAHWELTASVTYTVDFYYLTTDTEPWDSVVVPENTAVTAPTDPTRDGYVFDGWYTDTSFTTQYSFVNYVTQNLNLYAKWVTATYASDLFISEYGEGSSNNKWIEIYNGTGADVTLSGYSLQLYSNGSITAGNTYNLTGTIAAGDVYVIYNSSADQAIKDLGDVASGVANFNGNDAIVFLNGTTVIDAFGQVGYDPGTAWTVDGVSTVNMTLVRKPSVVSGDSNDSDTFDPSIEWDAYPQDTFTNIGSHTMDGSGTSGGDPETDTTAPDITVTDSKRNYLIGETVNLGCTAVDNVDGNVTCNTSGTVDTLIVGDYDVTYSATDSSSNTSTLVVTYTVRETYDYLSMDLMDYYNSAEGLTGTNLEAALRTIVSNYTYKSYDDARYILDETDRDPLNPNNVILIYTGWSVSGVWDAGATWNREHVWPQSLLGYDTTMSADLHNLKPADPGTNSSRSNKYYDYMTTSASYEPRDEVKGDVARILFYMMIRYSALDLVDTAPNTYQMGLLGVLLEWHYLDPVDDFERNRNEVIYSYQNNRNPFIDYEHFAELIFGSHSYYS